MSELVDNIDFKIEGVARSFMRNGDNPLEVTTTASLRTTLSCDVSSEGDTYQPSKREDIQVFEGVDLIFGGIIQKTIRHAIQGQVGFPEACYSTLIHAVDYNILAERKYVTAEIPAGTLKSQDAAILAELASLGVTVDGAQVDGPTMPALSLNRRRIDQARKDLARSAAELSGIPFIPEINFSKVARMYAPGTVAAPFDIDAASTDKFTDGDLTVEDQDNEPCDRLVLLAGKGEIDVINEQHPGDGVTRRFPLDLTAKGLPQIVEVHDPDLSPSLIQGFGVGIFGTDDTPWTLDFSTNELVQRVDQPIVAGDNQYINVPFYTGVLPMVIEVGVSPAAAEFEVVIEREDITTRAQAEAVAQAEFEIRQSQPRTIRYATYEVGLMPGMTQNIDVDIRDVDNDCLIVEVVIRDVQAETLRRDVMAIEGQTIQSYWQDFWRKEGGSTTTVGGTSISTGTGSTAHPGGEDQAVQSNGSGVFYGDTGFKYDRTLKKVTIKNGLLISNGGTPSTVIPFWLDPAFTVADGASRRAAMITPEMLLPDATVVNEISGLEVNPSMTTPNSGSARTFSLLAALTLRGLYEQGGGSTDIATIITSLFAGAPTGDVVPAQAYSGYFSMPTIGAKNAAAHFDNKISLNGVLYGVARRTFTDAQIKALPSTPLTFNVAPGSGKILALHRAFIYIDITSGAYTNVGDDAFLNIHTADWAQDQLSYLVNGNGTGVNRLDEFFSGSGGGTKMGKWLLPFAYDSPHFVFSWGLDTDILDFGAANNQDIELTIDNQYLGDFTGGHANNSMQVDVFYSVHP